MKFSTLKVVILTSLFWISLYIFIFQLSFPDCNNLREKIVNSDIIKNAIKPINTAISEFNSFTSSTKFGHLGEAVVVPDTLQLKSASLFYIHQFNIVASDLIGTQRVLGDYRNPECTSAKHPIEELYKYATSVIIVFHNEAWSTLLRTIHSVVERSPKELIHEILLVDDNSSMDHLKSQLDQYVAMMNTNKVVKIRVIRMPERKGLIVARVKGSKEASGKTITFLDAHVECTEGWLEPLLAEIAKDRKVVVCPIIDIISEENFQYIASAEKTWGGFNWDMVFRWEHTDRAKDQRLGIERTSPIKTPAMAGGLFTIEKDYFFEIGSYDEGMEIWGGENIEISVRVWTCGGQILIHPCSRVGHVFRSKSPYSWPGGVDHILSKNSFRTVNVWLDEYKNFYLKSKEKNVNESELMGDISERINFRKNHKCKSFKWFLEKIYPESNFPLELSALGQVKALDTGLCLDSMGKSIGETISLLYCHGLGGNQLLAFSETSGKLRFQVGCIDASLLNIVIRIASCTNRDREQKFIYDREKKTLKHNATGLCLDGITQQLRLAACTPSITKWSMDFLEKI